MFPAKLCKIYVATVAISITSVAFGQSSKDRPTILPSHDSGEVHSAVTDGLANEAAKTNERLFVIFHRGTNDTRSDINDLRIMRLKAYFDATQKHFGTDEPVFARGDAINGEGRIDYYLGSRLRLVVYARKNSIPNFTCCPDYQPPLKGRRKSRETQK